MKEPSVLDYVKSKIAFWSHSQIEIPPLEMEEEQRPADQPIDGEGGEVVPHSLNPAPDGGGSVIKMFQPVEPVQATPAPFAQLRAKPYAAAAMISISALMVALVAQAMMEPPGRVWKVAIAFYAFAAVLVGMAYSRGFIDITPAPERGAPPDGLRTGGLAVKIYPLAASLFFMAVTFLAFGRPQGVIPKFNPVNVFVWLLSILLLLWAFYLPPEENRLAQLRDRIAGFLRKPGWQINISRWTLLLLAVIGVVLFLRFYRLDTLPNEAVSDQTEKLLDVYDVLNGQLSVFFPRNTGREAFQFYWTVLIIKLFGTGVTFYSLKLGTTLIGLLTLYYIYRLGKETGNRWVALLALLFCGFSYWAQIQSRIGLRFPLYPGFYAPVLYYLIRGLRNRNRNDFLWAGIWLGIGLHGYTSFRIVPFVVVAAFGIYILHQRSPEARRFALWGLVILALVSLVVFMPLFRFSIDNWDQFASRSWSRLGNGERDLPGSPVLIFLQNSWNALTMFFWDDGDVWVHSVPHRPALDVITAALFFLGLVLLLLRYIRMRGWMDLFMLVSIPLLLLPSILSLAFPNENPNLNRTAAAYVPVFLIMALGLEALLRALNRSLGGRWAVVAPALLALALAWISGRANFDLVFNQYDQALRQGTWDSTEMGEVIRQFDQTFGAVENAWVVAFPYWVDTRLVGINAGYPNRDTAIAPENLPTTVNAPGNKLFILSPEDVNSLAQLQALYPEGRYWRRKSAYPGRDFYIFMTLSATAMPGEDAGVELPADMQAPAGPQ
jgi:4-amino-4-deoxy-L-arabinose transferase-like glycosyltransferase